MPKEIIYPPKQAGDGPNPYIEVQWAKGRSVNLTVFDRVALPQTGIAADLERASINRLIRALRKARDQAFGSDA